MNTKLIPIIMAVVIASAAFVSIYADDSDAEQTNPTITDYVGDYWRWDGTSFQKVAKVFDDGNGYSFTFNGQTKKIKNSATGDYSSTIEEVRENGVVKQIRYTFYLDESSSNQNEKIWFPLKDNSGLLMYSNDSTMYHQDKGCYKQGDVVVEGFAFNPSTLNDVFTLSRISGFDGTIKITLNSQAYLLPLC